MAHHLNSGCGGMADALDLGSSAFTAWGSTPFTRIRGSSSVVEHHLAKVGVAGSNPVFRSINDIAGVAELADAQDLKSCGEITVPVRFRSSAPSLIFAPVAQLDRAFDYGSRGYGFDSYRARLFYGK